MDEFWLQLGEIILVNLVLSGDNALLIAMATAGLPPSTRRFATIIGILGAIAIRLILTGVAAEIMTIPFVRAFGALLLVVIALKLAVGEETPPAIAKSSTVLSAAGVILLADVTMSIDNVAAVAGMAEGNLFLLALGLLISMGCMLLASVWIGTLLERFPQLMLMGSGILAWTAGRILAEDTGLSHLAGKYVWCILGILCVLAILINFYKRKELKMKR